MIRTHIFILAHVFLCFSGGLLFGKTIFISPSGNDSLAGTVDSPYRTIQKGLNNLNAGDSLLIREGGYAIKEKIVIQLTGKPNEWIFIGSYPGEKVTVTANRFMDTIVDSPEYRKMREAGAITVVNSNHIVISGICVYDAHVAGFYIHNSKNIELNYCKTFFTYNSGIGIWHSDSVKVKYCEIVQANTQENKPEGARRGREAPHEAISVASSNYFEISFNYLHNCVKEGIDVKETSSHGSVHHNLLHDINRQALYVDAWFGKLEDVAFYSNIVYNCEWGFCVSVEDQQSTLENVRCYDNLIYDCRGSGISFTRFGHDLPRSEVYIYNNTISNCGIPGHWAGKVGGIDIRSQNLSDVYIYNNIVYGNWGYEIASFDSTITKSILRERNIIIENNLTGPIHDKASPIGFFNNQVYSLGAVNNFVGNPHFISASTGNFHPGKSRTKVKPTSKFRYKTDFKYLGADISTLDQTKQMVLLKVHKLTDLR